MQHDFNEIMDILARSSRRQSFSTRFGAVGFSEGSSKTPTDIFECKPIVSFKSQGSTKFSNRIDFNEETFSPSPESEQLIECDSEKENIKSSEETYMGSRLFPCPVKNCSRVYTSSYGLKYHMDHGHTIAKMTERRPYICNVKNCGKTYKNNNGLKYHIMHAHKGVEYDESKCRIQ